MPSQIAQEEATSHKAGQKPPTIESIHPVATSPPSYGFTHDPSRRNPEHGGHASHIRLGTPQPRRTHPELVYPQSRFGGTPETDGTWLNSLPRVDDAPLPLPSTGVSEQDSSPSTRLPSDEPPKNSPTHNLMQSLRAESQRHQDTIASLKSELNTLNKELDRRKDLDTSEFNSDYPLALHMTNTQPN